MMEDIRGIPLNDFPFKELDKVADLIYFEGPLLSLFKNAKGDQYLYYWCDTDEQFNRWLVFRVTVQENNAFLSKGISLRELLLHSPDGLIFSVDIDDMLSYHNVIFVKVEDLPSSYIPNINSIYRFTPLIQAEHQDSTNHGYKIHLDGEWSLQDLSEVPHTYSGAYAFLYFLQQSKNLSKDLVSSFFKSHPWRGGYSTVNFYNELASFILPEHQPQIASIQYASPGWIEINLLDTVAFSIKNAVTAFVASSDELEAIYKEIYRELRNRGLLRDPKDHSEKQDPKKVRFPTRFSKMNELDFVNVASDTLVRLMRIDVAQSLENIANSELVNLKILLSFFRRIKVLAKYQAEGKANY